MVAQLFLGGCCAHCSKVAAHATCLLTCTVTTVSSQFSGVYPLFSMSHTTSDVPFTLCSASFLVMLFWEMIVMINKSFLFNILVFVTPKYVYSDLALYSLI